MILPDRISDLIKLAERGGRLTQSDVRRVAMLQALDAAKIGEDFVREHLAREADRTEQFRQALEDRQ